MEGAAGDITHIQAQVADTSVAARDITRIQQQGGDSSADTTLVNSSVDRERVLSFIERARGIEGNDSGSKLAFNDDMAENSSGGVDRGKAPMPREVQATSAPQAAAQPEDDPAGDQDGEDDEDDEDEEEEESSEEESENEEGPTEEKRREIRANRREYWAKDNARLKVPTGQAGRKPDPLFYTIFIHGNYVSGRKKYWCAACDEEIAASLTKQRAIKHCLSCRKFPKRLPRLYELIKKDPLALQYRNLFQKTALSHPHSESSTAKRKQASETQSSSKVNQSVTIPAKKPRRHFATEPAMNPNHLVESQDTRITDLLVMEALPTGLLNSTWFLDGIGGIEETSSIKGSERFYQDVVAPLAKQAASRAVKQLVEDDAQHLGVHITDHLSVGGDRVDTYLLINGTKSHLVHGTIAQSSISAADLLQIINLAKNVEAPRRDLVPSEALILDISSLVTPFNRVDVNSKMSIQQNFPWVFALEDPQTMLNGLMHDIAIRVPQIFSAFQGVATIVTYFTKSDSARQLFQKERERAGMLDSSLQPVDHRTVSFYRSASIIFRHYLALRAVFESGELPCETDAATRTILSRLLGQNDPNAANFYAQLRVLVTVLAPIAEAVTELGRYPRSLCSVAVHLVGMMSRFRQLLSSNTPWIEPGILPSVYQMVAQRLAIFENRCLYAHDVDAMTNPQKSAPHADLLLLAYYLDPVNRDHGGIVFPPASLDASIPLSQMQDRRLSHLVRAAIAVWQAELTREGRRLTMQDAQDIYVSLVAYAKRMPPYERPYPTSGWKRILETTGHDVLSRIAIKIHSTYVTSSTIEAVRQTDKWMKTARRVGISGQDLIMGAIYRDSRLRESGSAFKSTPPALLAHNQPAGIEYKMSTELTANTLVLYGNELLDSFFIGVSAVNSLSSGHYGDANFTKPPWGSALIDFVDLAHQNLRARFPVASIVPISSGIAYYQKKLDAQRQTQSVEGLWNLFPKCQTRAINP